MVSSNIQSTRAMPPTAVKNCHILFTGATIELGHRTYERTTLCQRAREWHISGSDDCTWEGPPPAVESFRFQNLVLRLSSAFLKEPMRTYLLFLPWLASTAVGPVSGFVATVTIALWNASDFSGEPTKRRNAETQTIQEAESSSSQGKSETEEDPKAKKKGKMLEGYVWTYNAYDVSNFTKFGADG